MGAAVSHGITMGYASGPYRTEDQNPDPEGVALPAHGGTMGRVFETRREKPQRKMGAAPPMVVP